MCRKFGFFAILFPRQVGKMHHAVDISGQTDKQTKFGDVAYLAIDFSANWVGGTEIFPWIACALFEPK